MQPAMVLRDYTNMPTFLLRLKTPRNTVVHEVRSEHPNAASALADAGVLVRQLLAAPAAPDINCRLDVEDQSGRPVARLLLREEMALC